MEFEVPPQHWKKIGDSQLQCTFCPRFCVLSEGQRGICFVRQNLGGRMILRAYGRSTGLAIDPVEKKPLFHFLPGSRTLSFGTAGCNLTCSFCQNWQLSRAPNESIMIENPAPDEIADLALEKGCQSVSFTYNEPLVFAEYAVDVARACHVRGVKTIAVTAGYVNEDGREFFFDAMDGANVDLKGFTEEFYHKHCSASLEPVLQTLQFIARQKRTFLEITTLLIPGENDSPEEITGMTRWIAQELGSDVPVHFSAFHPAYRMMDHERTTPEKLFQAREIAIQNGLKHVYTGNILDDAGAVTSCAHCNQVLIRRAGFSVLKNMLLSGGLCPSCGAHLCGVFETL